jgi:hypothetical protein
MVLEDPVDPRILRGPLNTLLLEHEPQAFSFLSFLLSMLCKLLDHVIRHELFLFAWYEMA